jgi:hypothetical protein
MAVSEEPYFYVKYYELELRERLRRFVDPS